MEMENILHLYFVSPHFRVRLQAINSDEFLVRYLCRVFIEIYFHYIFFFSFHFASSQMNAHENPYASKKFVIHSYVSQFLKLIALRIKIKS